MISALRLCSRIPLLPSFKPMMRPSLCLAHLRPVLDSLFYAGSGGSVQSLFCVVLGKNCFGSSSGAIAIVCTCFIYFLFWAVLFFTPGVGDFLCNCFALLEPLLVAAWTRFFTGLVAGGPSTLYAPCSPSGFVLLVLLNSGST
uniref:Transmembrane protein n=1 Tax=Opuntia streptacantha TaxID=393608 RepID=A0A7C8YIY2_OPUST